MENQRKINVNVNAFITSKINVEFLKSEELIVTIGFIEIATVLENHKCF